MAQIMKDTWVWSSSEETILQKLNSSVRGISHSEALKRLHIYGPNAIHTKKTNVFTLFIRQITSNPLILILTIATVLSFLLGQQVSAYYIFAMILVSISLGFWNEYSAERTVEMLMKKISLLAVVVREGEKQELPVPQITIGDVVLLSPGSIIPADIRLLEADNLEVNQSALTGESKLLIKKSAPLDGPIRDINELNNIGFMGTNVVSGCGKGVVLRTGADTEFGTIAKSTSFLKPTTEFQKGLASFGDLIVKVILVLTVGIFAVNAFLGHQWLESLLFSLAIAVGLTPELLPVIVTISLSHGAGKLAKKHVIAKQLISLENLGNMDVLCTDKTGTLTEGEIQVVAPKNEKLLELALLCNNAIVHHRIFGNSIDVALWEYAQKYDITPPEMKKVFEEAFDYDKKCMFTVVAAESKQTLIAKGAPEAIFDRCTLAKDEKKTLHSEYIALSNEGYRVIALATKAIESKETYVWKDADRLEFSGFITFLDTPKKTSKDALLLLSKLHVAVKVVTGDNELVTKKICKEVGMEVSRIIVGDELDLMSEQDLKSVIQETTVFARVSPEQKLRVIQTLQQLGHTVGYLGDGINDIPSLHSADVGISVNSAVDVAKDAASLVLLRKSLHVLADGIIEGRRTFSNTIKYILMGTSSNFGNMFSAAGASFFLPFLPMTPVQILLNNGLYDISQMSIPSDTVDAEELRKPRHWNIQFIRNYMIFFGPLSSFYDFLTFAILLFVFHAPTGLFQTGWFIESLATQVLVVFIIRTARRPFFLSKPSFWLLATCISVVAAGVLIPFTPFGKSLGFVSPPPLYFAILALLVTTYLFLVETVKSVFIKKVTG
ncbi:magnesium-translocating P-type ATPase [Candidatus Roizmanbacteria bacterium]|nr:magnesium-translocating P-type ATPase [Candidatus Roizmanbacteria bacterium]